MDRIRIDKWLWAARFYKTRSLAAEAVEGGKVRVNGATVKPAKEVKPGDRLALRIGEIEWDVRVEALSDKRGSAAVAQGLYEESEDSRRRRAERAEARRIAREPAADIKGRPTKRDRRTLERWKGG